MFGPKQLVEVLSRLFSWNRPPPKTYRRLAEEKPNAPSTSDVECGHINFDWHKTPFYNERAKNRVLRGVEKAGKSADRECCRGSGSALLIFLLISSLLLALVYIGKLHSTPGCALGGSQAAFQLATALSTTLSTTQEQLQRVATSILGRPEARTLLVGIVTKADDMERRAMLREVYSPVKPAGVDVFYVFPRQEDASIGLLLELESQKFQDIIVLNDTLTSVDGQAFEVRIHLL